MKNENRLLKSFLSVFLIIATVSAMAQVKLINGKVTDSGSMPLPGVTVVEKGTTNGVITNADGNYEIRVSSGNTTLIFSYIGMQTREIAVNNQSTLNVTLSDETFGVDEVVVVGYGTQKKVNLTGAVAAIEGEAISKKASTDVLSAMQGEMPGVAVLRSSGQPGKETSGLRIRGFSSANDTKALVLIDGVEGDMNLLNPNDIESVSILKDAAAAAIYGARAAAGVVLITTKSGGDTGKVKVNYNGYYGVNTPGIMPERVTAWKEQELINISRKAATGAIEWPEEMSSWVASRNFDYRSKYALAKRWDYFAATNWVDEGTKDFTTQQNHSVSVSGGTKVMNYLMSGGYYTKDGLLKYGPDGYDRYNFRLKMDSEISQYVSVGVQASYSGAFTETNPYGVDNILERLYRIRARQPIFVPEEDINYSIQPYNGDLQVNPIDLMINGGIEKNRKEAYMGKGNITIKDVIPGLRVNLSASRQNTYYSAEKRMRNLTWYDMAGVMRFEANNPNSLYKTKNYDYHDNLEATINYDLKFGKSTINALAGTTYENYRYDKIEATAQRLNSNDFFSFNYYEPLTVNATTAAVANNTTIGDSIATWAMQSYFGRLNYNFDNRYIFEANIRYDGSSRLAPERRWQAFPSFSAAWRLSEESWFDLSSVSNIKLRASWGQLGNGAVLGLYDYIATITNDTHMNDMYYYQKALASHSKTWETIETTNIGVDLGFFDNRLSFTGDYYWKYNKNMLASLQLPSLLGVEVSKANVGELKTWGWELELRWRDEIGDFSYQAAVNVSDNQNKLLKFDGKSVINAGKVDLLEGYAMNTIWGYETDGYWNSREEYLQYKADNPGYKSFNDGIVSAGDVRYVAQGAADHTISAGNGTPEEPGDLVYMGSSDGRYLFGINLAAQWKGFDLSLFFQGVGQRSFIIKTNTIAPFWQTSTMPWTVHLDYWTPENTDAYFPRMYQNNGDDFNYKPSDKWVQNGAYIRLKNVQLGYNLPFNKRFIEKARIYISGADVWEYSNVLPVFDPEVGNDAGADYYPFFRTWSLGLNITF